MTAVNQSKMDTPPELVLRPSEVDPDSTGIWSKSLIKNGQIFGPFAGSKTLEASDHMDPTYVWEIVDQSTKEFLFYIDATKEEDGNWMRYINCARYYEEQNIVSEQRDIDIYYRAIRDIPAGEELLTWYEKIPLRRRQRERARRTTTQHPTERLKQVEKEGRSRSPSAEKVHAKVVKNCSSSAENVVGKTVKSRSPSEEKVAQKLSDGNSGGTVKVTSRQVEKVLPKTIKKTNQGQPSEKVVEKVPSRQISSVRRRVAPKRYIAEDDSEQEEENNDEDEENIEEDEDEEDEDREEDDHINDEEDDDNEKEDMESLSGSIASSKHDETGSSHSPPEEGKFQFELQEHHVIKSRQGRKVFKCDVCSGIYRHAFSLKRHFIRNHVNFKYVSRADLMNCQVNLDAQENAETKVKAETVIGEENQLVKQEPADDYENVRENDKPQGNILIDSDIKHSDNTDKTECSKEVKTENDNNFSTKNEHKKDEDANETDVKDGDGGGEEDVSGMFPGLYKCNVCGDLFDDIPGLRDHVSNHPEVPNMKAFSCDKCDMKFSHKQNLMRHQAVHTKEKPYTCRFCGKKFPTATNQKRHERIHLGRRISCDYCSSTFTQSGDLKKHIRKLHPECFHECAFCGKYYADEQGLEEHLLSHDENLDSNKDEATRRTHAFKVDMEQDRMESMKLAEQKPGFKFACTICQKRFHDYANMCRHRRLAHQRHLLMSKKNRDGIDTGLLSPTKYVVPEQCDVDPQSYFYANVARNISENLKYFVEGRQDQLSNPDTYIKWKKEDTNTNKTESSLECENYSKYNFPLGFEPKLNFTKIMEQKKIVSPEAPPSVQNGAQRTVLCVPNIGSGNIPSVHIDKVVIKGSTVLSRSQEVLSRSQEVGHTPASSQALLVNTSSSSQTLVIPTVVSSLSGQSGLKLVSSTLPPLTRRPDVNANVEKVNKNPAVSAITTSTAVSTAKTAASLPISVPRVRFCAVCRCIFHRFEQYQAHMASKHKVSVANEVASPSESRGSPVPSQSASGIIPSPSAAAEKAAEKLTLNIPTVRSSGAVDLTKNGVPQVYDENGALDLSSPTRETVDFSALAFGTYVDGRPDLRTIYNKLVTNKMDSTKKHACPVCHEGFPDESVLSSHQKTVHPDAIVCSAPLWQKPSPVGLLNLCSSQVPTTEDYATPEVKYSCTKCSETFSCTDDLHKHIVVCAKHSQKTSRLSITVDKPMFLKGLGRVRKKVYQFIETADGRPIKPQLQVKKKVKCALLRKLSEKKSEEDLYSQRKRSVELLYNPRNHVRRREMKQVLDMHRCGGCRYRFSSISLLERHIRVCTHKDKIKQLHTNSHHLNTDHSKKYQCVYCKKYFSYVTSVKKHYQEVCAVRKDRLKRGDALDHRWENSIKAAVAAKEALEEDKDENGMKRRKGRRKNRKWGNAKKRKHLYKNDTESVSSTETLEEEEEEEEEDDASDKMEEEDVFENEDNDKESSMDREESVATPDSGSTLLDEEDDVAHSTLLEMPVVAESPTYELVSVNSNDTPNDSDVACLENEEGINEECEEDKNKDVSLATKNEKEDFVDSAKGGENSVIHSNCGILNRQILEKDQTENIKFEKEAEEIGISDVKETEETEEPKIDKAEEPPMKKRKVESKTVKAKVKKTIEGASVKVSDKVKEEECKSEDGSVDEGFNSDSPESMDSGIDEVTVVPPISPQTPVATSSGASPSLSGPSSQSIKAPAKRKALSEKTKSESPAKRKKHVEGKKGKTKNESSPKKDKTNEGMSPKKRRSGKSKSKNSGGDDPSESENSSDSESEDIADFNNATKGVKGEAKNSKQTSQQSSAKKMGAKSQEKSDPKVSAKQKGKKIVTGKSEAGPEKEINSSKASKRKKSSALKSEIAEESEEEMEESGKDVKTNSSPKLSPKKSPTQSVLKTKVATKSCVSVNGKEENVDGCKEQVIQVKATKTKGKGKNAKDVISEEEKIEESNVKKTGKGGPKSKKSNVCKDSEEDANDKVKAAKGATAVSAKDLSPVHGEGNSGKSPKKLVKKATVEAEKNSSIIKSKKECGQKGKDIGGKAEKGNSAGIPKKQIGKGNANKGKVAKSKVTEESESESEKVKVKVKASPPGTRSKVATAARNMTKTKQTKGGAKSATQVAPPSANKTQQLSATKDKQEAVKKAVVVKRSTRKR